MSRLSQPLHSAVRDRCYPWMAKFLLLAGANVNSQDCTGKSVLHYACELKMQKVVSVLLEAGAEVNAHDVNGRTPLHVACKGMKSRAVITLLRHGGKIGLVDDKGRTPLHEIASMETYFYNRMTDDYQLNTTAEGSENRFFQHLADSLKDDEIVCVVNLKDKSKNTALHLASQRNNKKLVCLL